jgi:hypothetical protein
MFSVLAINISTALKICQRNRTTLVVKVAMKPSSKRINAQADGPEPCTPAAGDAKVRSKTEKGKQCSCFELCELYHICSFIHQRGQRDFLSLKRLSGWRIQLR